MTSREVTGAKNASQATHAAHRDLLATAVAAAVRATDVIRQRAGDPHALTWQEKSPADFVSDVDRAAEAAITELIHQRQPHAVILGEELTPGAALDAETVFVVDPLDGTTNFLHRYPSFAVSIGVLHEGRLAAGVVLDVSHGDLFTATAGGGARHNGQPIRVSPITEPSRALIGTGFPFKSLHLLDDYQRQFAAVLRRTAGIRRAGSAALDLCDVAAGRFEAFWELVLAPWDVAAGILIVREAGGVVTNLAGQPAEVAHGPIVAGNPEMHRWLLETVAGG